MKKASASVLLDTNFLLVPSRFGIDIFEEIEKLLETQIRFIVTSPVLNELNQLGSDKKTSISKKVQIAFSFSNKCTFLDSAPNIGENIDDMLIRIAKDNGFILATTDSLLRRKCRKEGITVVYLRQKSYLALNGLKP